MSVSEPNRGLRRSGKPYPGDDLRRETIARTIFEIAEVLELSTGAEVEDETVQHAERAFRVLGQVIADAAAADDAETLRLAEEWCYAVIERWTEDKDDELGWDAWTVGRLEGIREAAMALAWIAMTRGLGLR